MRGMSKVLGLVLIACCSLLGVGRTLSPLWGWQVQFPYTQPLPTNLCRKALGLPTGLPGFGNRRGLYRA